MSWSNHTSLDLFPSDNTHLTHRMLSERVRRRSEQGYKTDTEVTGNARRHPGSDIRQEQLGAMKKKERPKERE